MGKKIAIVGGSGFIGTILTKQLLELGYDIVNGLILVGENGYGDEFGIGSPEAYTIKEIAEMYDGEIVMLPERKGNRMTADVISAKTEALGWKPVRTIKEYIDEQRNAKWEL